MHLGSHSGKPVLPARLGRQRLPTLHTLTSYPMNAETEIQFYKRIQFSYLDDRIYFKLIARYQSRRKSYQYQKEREVRDGY